jgi:hypothetical protein
LRPAGWRSRGGERRARPGADASRSEQIHGVDADGLHPGIVEAAGDPNFERWCDQKVRGELTAEKHPIDIGRRDGMEAALADAVASVWNDGVRVPPPPANSRTYPPDGGGLLNPSSEFASA